MACSVKDFWSGGGAGAGGRSPALRLSLVWIRDGYVNRPVDDGLMDFFDAMNLGSISYGYGSIPIDTFLVG